MRQVRDSDLPATTRLVALTIGLRASLDGGCYPSYERIALDTGMTRRAAITHVKRLIDEHWLLAVGRCNGRGRQSNAYQLVDNRLWKTDEVVNHVHHLVNDVHPLGSEPRSPRSEWPREVLAEPAEPVDNPPLSAVISMMSRQHTSPTRTWKPGA